MILTCRCSNAEVHRTCQFVKTVLTPAATGNEGLIHRFDFIIYIHTGRISKSISEPGMLVTEFFYKGFFTEVRNREVYLS
ncbi:hypothetical protein BH18ACI3_BH18ACI3_14490 [soil metagenome]